MGIRRRSLPTVGHRVLVACVLLAGGLMSVSAHGQEPLGETSRRLAMPPSRLGEPFEAPILVGVFAAGGGGAGEGQSTFEGGVGGWFVMRPGSVDFFEFLYRWNLGTVLQVDYQRLSETDDALSADGILRRYFNDRGRDNTEVLLFAGLGLGATRITVPGTGGAQDDRYFSGLVEVGQEWLVDRKWYVCLKGQYRLHLQPHRHYGVWSLQLGVGAPWPF